VIYSSFENRLFVYRVGWQVENLPHVEAAGLRGILLVLD